jgi:hypothetical protein
MAAHPVGISKESDQTAGIFSQHVSKTCIRQPGAFRYYPTLTIETQEIHLNTVGADVISIESEGNPDFFYFAPGRVPPIAAEALHRERERGP